MQDEKFSNPTLRRQLVKLVLMAFLPVAAALLLDGWLSRSDELKSASAVAIKEVRLATAEQTKNVSAVAELLTSIASGYAAAQVDPVACGRHFRTLLDKLNHLANIGLLDKNGYIICTGVGTDEFNSYANRIYFREAKVNNSLAVSGVTLGMLSRQRSIIFGYPRHTPDGTFAGIVFATFRDVKFARPRPASHEHVTARFTYYDRYGEVIVADASETQTDSALTEQELARVSAEEGKPVSYATRASDGAPLVAALAPIDAPFGRVGYVRAVIDQKEVLRSWRDEMVLRVGAVVVTLLCGLALVGWFLERWLVRDLRHMIEFTDMASRTSVREWSDWSVRVSTAEARTAMMSMMHMARTLQEQREQLSRLHTEAHAANVRLESKQTTLETALNRLERLSVQLVNAQEQERKHLARELHDELGQRLTALNLVLHAMQPFLREDPGRKMWRQAESDVTSLIREVRALSVSLRPPALDFFSLEAAVQQLIDRQFANSGIDCELETAGIPEKLDEPTEITAYRLIQEGLTNVLRHADATRVMVEINGGEHGHELEVVVRDNGRGFELSPQAGQTSGRQGSGMLGMRERVELLGGEIHIESEPGKGTRIVATLPLKNANYETTEHIAGG